MNPSGCACCQLQKNRGSARAVAQHPVAVEKAVHQSSIEAEHLEVHEIERTDRVEGQQCTVQNMERGDQLDAHQRSCLVLDYSVSCYTARVVDTGLDTAKLLGSATIAGYDSSGWFVLLPTIDAGSIGRAVVGLAVGSMVVEFGAALDCVPAGRCMRV